MQMAYSYPYQIMHTPSHKSNAQPPFQSDSFFAWNATYSLYVLDKIIIVCYLSYDLELKTIRQVILYPTILP